MEKIIIWGTGNFGSSKFYVSLLEKAYKISGYCDSDPSAWGKKINGYVVLSKEELSDLAEETDHILVTVADERVYHQIRESIDEYHLPKRVKVSWFRDIYYDLLKKNMNVLRPVNAYESKEICFIDQAEIWLDNIMSEVAFWTDIVAKPGAKNRSNYEKRLQNKKFTSELTQNTCRLEAFLENRDGAVVYDIGCGLAPRFGEELQSDGKIQLIGVDPLAYFYNEINRKYANTECRAIAFGMFEFISKFVEKDRADAVIINNALDHCIDPFRSIAECLNILKVGGILHLNHGRTEGLIGMYQGLHQWNLDYDEHSDFIIWNYNVMINVSEKLREVADVQVYYSEEQVPLNEQFVCVEIRKKKEFDLKQIIHTENEVAELAFLVGKLMKMFSSSEFNLVFNHMLSDEENRHV